MDNLDLFIATKSKFFEPHQLPMIRQRLADLRDDQWSAVQMLQFKDPTMMLLVSLFGGSLGIDRFVIGDVGMGIGKLLTCGGFGIWTIVDWFMITGATKEKNLQTLNELFIRI